MAKKMWYDGLTQMSAGVRGGFTAIFNAIFPGVQAEFELRHSLESGFFEPIAVGTGLGLTITNNGESTPTVNLTWPLSKGALLNGIRIGTPANWVFNSSVDTGLYNLYLDNACTSQIVLASTPNSNYLLIATVSWNSSALTLSTLTPVALAVNGGMSIIGVNSEESSGSVTQVNGEDPNNLGYVTVDVSVIPYANVPTGSGWTGGLSGALTALNSALSTFFPKNNVDATVSNDTTITSALVSDSHVPTLLNVWYAIQNQLSGISFAWSAISDKPSAFTPSNHASTHEPNGDDPIISNDSTLGGSTPSATIAATQSAIQEYVAANAGDSGDVHWQLLGTFNGETGNITLLDSSSGGTIIATPLVGDVFYRCNAAGTYNIGGWTNWNVLDICVSVQSGAGFIWTHLPGGAIPIVSDDTALGGSSPSTSITSSQNAVQSFVASAISAINKFLTTDLLSTSSASNTTITGSSTDLTIPSSLNVWYLATSLISAIDRFFTLSTITALGDLVYGSASATIAKLSGNTTTTKKFLQQIGDGSASAAPVWGVPDVADIACDSPPSGFNGITTLNGLLSAFAALLASFNGAGQLVQLDSSSPTPKLPVADGSQLVNLPLGVQWYDNAGASSSSPAWNDGTFTIKPSIGRMQSVFIDGPGRTFICANFTLGDQVTLRIIDEYSYAVTFPTHGYAAGNWDWVGGTPFDMTTVPYGGWVMMTITAVLCNDGTNISYVVQCDEQHLNVPVIDVTSTDIAMNGTQAAGSTGKVADAGHVHPTDTSRAEAANFTAVTNDAQLKRAAGDYSSFTAKAAPVDADVVLIEDSAASGAKKSTTLGEIIALVPGGVTLDTTAAHIQMDGTQAAGSQGLAADSGHVHPTDTSRAATTALPPYFIVANLVDMTVAGIYFLTALNKFVYYYNLGGSNGYYYITAPIDTTATDIQMDGTQAAGSIGKVADSGHVHPTDTSRAATTDIPVIDQTATDIQMDGTQAAGSIGKVADAGHVHPTDTSRAAAADIPTTMDVDAITYDNPDQGFELKDCTSLGEALTTIIELIDYDINQCQPIMVEAVQLTAPSPSDGLKVLINGTAGSGFTTSNSIATYTNGIGWAYSRPNVGVIACNLTDGKCYVFNGSTWPQLVLPGTDGKLPAIDGSNLTGITLAKVAADSSITPITDGTYTVGIGTSQNGTITVAGGIITAVQQAS